VKCACPCGEKFEPARSNQVYLNAEHRERDKNRRWPVKRQSLLLVPLRDSRGARKKAKTTGVTPLLGTQMAQTKKREPDWPHVEMFDKLFEEDCLLTGRQVARLLAVSPGTLKGWRRTKKGRTGEGPEFIRVGGLRVRYSLRAVREYLSEHTLRRQGEGQR